MLLVVLFLLESEPITTQLRTVSGSPFVSKAQTFEAKQVVFVPKDTVR